MAATARGRTSTSLGATADGTLEEVTGRAVAHVERVVLESVLRECQWNKTRAAEKLGVSPKTLLAKLRSAGLEE